MNKHISIPVLSAAFVLLGITTFGINILRPTKIHAQTSEINTQQDALERDNVLTVDDKVHDIKSDSTNEKGDLENSSDDRHGEINGITTGHEIKEVE